MKEKRQKAAAAEIFRQQNVILNEEKEEETAEFDEIDQEINEISPQMAAPPPSPRAIPLPAMELNLGSPKPRTHRPETKKRDKKQMDSFKTSEELQLEKGPIEVRETGFFIWKRVIVPPNAYVIHTRIGQQKPVTLGLGLSFRYNPQTDAYLIVPAAMQTIGVVANCISQEKQGINVLAYVQWQISDFSIAYRKLDFSDRNDPIAVVNAQLREQADAAIKDKIATMRVSEVLADKAPVIEELTRRLIEVTEGRVRGSAGTEEGLGIKIVTVQIKEALVSSQRLWEHLQAPFRHEQERNARISYLNMQEEIRQQELETRQFTQTSEAEARVNIERVQQAKKTEEIEIRLEEEEKRTEREQSMLTNKLRLERESAIEKAKSDAETQASLRELNIQRQINEAEENRQLAEEKARIEQARLQYETDLNNAMHEYNLLLQQQADTLEQAQLQGNLNRERVQQLSEIEIERLHSETQYQLAIQETEISRLKQEIQNLANNQSILVRWIENLPELAAQMPEIEKLNVLQMGEGENNLGQFISQQMALIGMLRNFLKDDSASTNNSNNGTPLDGA